MWAREDISWAGFPPAGWSGTTAIATMCAVSGAATRALTGALATRLTGSSDIFEGEKTRSVNFIASHDGFTLADLVAYAQKHNEANGEDNRDGQQENFSWNNGVEGPSADPDIVHRRKADQRALLATLFASRGTIQLTAGDEFGRTQRGQQQCLCAGQ